MVAGRLGSGVEPKPAFLAESVLIAGGRPGEPVGSGLNQRVLGLWLTDRRKVTKSYRSEQGDLPQYVWLYRPASRLPRRTVVWCPGRSLGATLGGVGGRIRVVVAKPGLDGHDRGAKVVARALRDAGMEVVYTGLHQTPEQIVKTALQEDADAVGLSVLSGAHMTLFARVIELLKGNGATDVVVFGGGIIPEEDIPSLTELGVAKVFTPGASTHEIVDWVRGAVAATVE
jgi:methylmalonyl-CoA mutase, C-terminal domain